LRGKSKYFIERGCSNGFNFRYDFEQDFFWEEGVFGNVLVVEFWLKIMEKRF
jgi:hypothetical protein